MWKVTAEHIWLSQGHGFCLYFSKSIIWWHGKILNISVYITDIETFAVLVITYILMRNFILFYFIFSGVLYGESIFWQNLLLFLTGIVSNYMRLLHSSHLPNCQWRKPNYTIFAFRQTQTIGHITKLLVDCRWKVLPDCFYLLKEDGCDINHSLSCKAYLRKKKL